MNNERSDKSDHPARRIKYDWPIVLCLAGIACMPAGWLILVHFATHSKSDIIANSVLFLFGGGLLLCIVAPFFSQISLFDKAMLSITSTLFAVLAFFVSLLIWGVKLFD